MKASNLIGLVPMAGQAKRLSPLPVSKELLPIGLSHNAAGNASPKVVSHYLLDTFRAAGIHKAVMVLRRGKWDIPNYYGDGSAFGLELAYTLMKLHYGVPYTLDSAYAFVRGHHVAVGFPDIVYEPEDAFAHMLDKLKTSRADIVLGLFPASAPNRSDMVELNETGEVRAIVIKPSETQLRLSWGLALWSPSFTEFLHTYLATHTRTGDEVQLSSVLMAGMAAGLKAVTVTFEAGGYWDIGTPEGYKLALEKFGV